MHFGLKPKTIILVGQPNAGKTTLFNSLTGGNFRTGNYPGITVDYFVGQLNQKYGKTDWRIIDSPGLNSLNAKSEDERVTVGCLANHPEFGVPDLIVSVLDSSQLARQLYLLKQLQEANFNIVVAVTMTDILAQKHLQVDFATLSKEFKLKFIPINARLDKGIEELVATIKSNLNEIENPLEPKIPNEYSKEYILSTFKQLSLIEKEVLKPLSNINQVNKKLNLVSNANPTTRKIDKILLHPFLGGVFFVLIMGFLFTSIFWMAEPVMDLIDSIFGVSANFVTSHLEESLFRDLIVDGVITGIGSVLIFVPQIVILFFLMGVLEDSGYLSRAAVIIDYPLKKLGLSGRSFVPMLSGFACAIPGMLAAKSILNYKERMLTIFIMPLMSCSARLPVYALLLTFITPKNKPWIGGIGLMLLYSASIFFGSVAAGIAGKFIRKKDVSVFTLELPAYRFPVWKLIFRSTFNNSKSYLTKAGIPILIISLFMWAFTYFPGVPDNIPKDAQLDRIEYSYASQVSKFIEPVFHPIGGDWRVGVSLISAFAAREVFVSSLALVFHITDENEDSLQNSLLKSMENAKIESTGEKLFTFSSVIGLMVFFAVALQCLTTVVVSRKETGSWLIPLLQVVCFTVSAYFLTVLAVQGLRFLGLS